MSPAINIEYISYEQTRIYSDQFLKKHHPSLSIPIPIEDIAELKLRLNVIALPGLVKEFKSLGAECLGFLSSDLSSIYIDYHIWETHNHIYRSTLAHELGHMVLHEKFYKERPFDDKEGFKEFVRDMQLDSSSLSRFEIQANNFAGLVLVPKQKLVEVMDRNVPSFRTKIKGHPGLKNLGEDEAWEVFHEIIAKEFEVSSHVISKRIEFEKLKSKYKLVS